MFDAQALYGPIDPATVALIQDRSWASAFDSLHASVASGNALALLPLAALNDHVGNQALAERLAAEAISKLDGLSPGFLYRVIADWTRELDRLSSRGRAINSGSPAGAAVLKWYRLAADTGDAEALYSLGKPYGPLGDGKQGDDAQRSKWMRAAAEAGHPAAAYPMAQMHHHQQDLESAERWYRVAVDAAAAGAATECSPEIGEAVVMLALAELLDQTGSSEAEGWFKRAAASGLDRASLLLARWYETHDRPDDADQTYDALARRGLHEAPILRDYLLSERRLIGTCGRRSRRTTTPNSTRWLRCATEPLRWVTLPGPTFGYAPRPAMQMASQTLR